MSNSTITFPTYTFRQFTPEEVIGFLVLIGIPMLVFCLIFGWIWYKKPSNKTTKKDEEWR